MNFQPGSGINVGWLTPGTTGHFWAIVAPCVHFSFRVFSSVTKESLVTEEKTDLKKTKSNADQRLVKCLGYL